MRDVVISVVASEENVRAMLMELSKWTIVGLLIGLNSPDSIVKVIERPNISAYHQQAD